jgi:hypothetical protein
MHKQFSVENLRDKGKVGDLDIDGRIIVKGNRL